MKNYYDTLGTIQNITNDEKEKIMEEQLKKQIEKNEEELRNEEKKQEIIINSIQQKSNALIKQQKIDNDKEIKEIQKPSNNKNEVFLASVFCILFGLCMLYFGIRFITHTSHISDLLVGLFMCFLGIHFIFLAIFKNKWVTLLSNLNKIATLFFNILKSFSYNIGRAFQFLLGLLFFVFGVLQPFLPDYTQTTTETKIAMFFGGIIFGLGMIAMAIYGKSNILGE